MDEAGGALDTLPRLPAHFTDIREAVPMWKQADYTRKQDAMSIKLRCTNRRCRANSKGTTCLVCGHPTKAMAPSVNRPQRSPLYKEVKARLSKLLHGTPTEKEVQEAVKRVEAVRASRMDNMPLEIVKCPDESPSHGTKRPKRAVGAGERKPLGEARSKARSQGSRGTAPAT